MTRPGMLGGRCLSALLLVALAGCDRTNGDGPAGTAGGDQAAVKAGGSGDLVADGKKVFDTKCVACHTIGQGVRLGPDLHGVTGKRSHEWLVAWIKDPPAFAKKDEEAKKHVEEWKDKGVMAALGLTDHEIRAVIAYMEAESKKPKAAATTKKQPVELAKADFERAKRIYFDRCTGCHGALRKGATGPNIEPKRAKELGVDGLIAILTNGTPGGMPAWGKEGILSAEEIELMANYLHMPAPEPPQLPLAEIRKTWKLRVAPADRPTKLQTKRDWENYFGVVLRDAGKVAIIDGDTKELVNILDTGYAVHILRSSSTGRYFYAVGRDGRVTMIDLWPEKPTIVATVQGCFDARSVDGSKYHGYEDKLVIEGCYWPPQYVVMDGQTLEPKSVTSVLTPTYDTNEPLKEVRVASIIASHDDPLWVVSLKESGHVALVDYSKPGFPIVSKIPGERFLHDGGWDHTKRYFMVAANMRNQMVVVDVKNKKFVAKFETGNKPHPGRGANWKDPEFGWVNATTHIGEGKLTVYGADPEGSPQHAWKVVREVKLPAAGGLFVKTHEKSPWVWMDSPLSNEQQDTRGICVYSKPKGAVEKCWEATDHGRIVHFEYNRAGDEVWTSVWDGKGELIIYDDKTLKEKRRIRGDWLVTPTGKFNVYNSAHDVY